MLRVHGYQTDAEPWRFGGAVEDQVRQYLELRYRLLPYIYSQAAAVTFQGSTLMRPLVMDFPEDSNALAQNYEYMFGPSFLVAPVLQSDIRQWQVYAPSTQGGWFDWWTEARVQGGTTAAVDAPLTKLPLLVKAGSIVPLGPAQEYAGQNQTGHLELRVYPGADAAFTLYEDAGVNYQYEKGASSRIPIQWNDRLRRLTLGKRVGSYPGMIGKRRVTVHIAGSSTATDKHLDYTGKAVSIPSIL